MDKIIELKNQITAIEADAEKFYKKGNRAAGVRVRKGAQKIKKLAGELRADVLVRIKEEAV